MKKDFITQSNVSCKTKSSKKKLSFFVVLSLLIFCILGSFLGTLSFFRVHAEDDPLVDVPNVIIPLDYSSSLGTVTWDNGNLNINLNGSGTYNIVSIPVFEVDLLPGYNYTFYNSNFYNRSLAYDDTLYFSGGNVDVTPNLEFLVINGIQNFTYTGTSPVRRTFKLKLRGDYAYNFTFGVRLWQYDVDYTDIESSIYYEIGKLQGISEGYNIGYTDGAGSFESSLGIFSQATFKYFLSNTMSFRDSDITTYHFEHDYYAFLPTDNVLFDGYYNGVYIHYQGLDNFYFDSANKSWDNLITDNTSTFIVRAFFGDYGVDFSNLYMFTTFTKTGGIFYNRFIEFGQNICFWFSDGTSLNYSSADSYYSSFDLLQYSSKKLVAIDFYTNRSDIELPSLMTDINAGTSYSLGYEDGFFDGRSSSSDSAYSKGYDAGYAVGVHNSGDYTFFGLMSAVLDAPVQAFSGLFNFNIFGINFLSIFTFLITLAVVIKILSLLK